MDLEDSSTIAALLEPQSRRGFLRLAAYGGAVFVSAVALGGASAAETRAARPRVGSRAAAAARSGFYFVQLSDAHWGFDGPAINPDSRGTLEKAVAAVNALDEAPDFVVFTGDLTHTTDDGHERSERMKRFRDIVSKLRVKQVHFMPGEHDAALDRGDAYQKHFGKLHDAFDHKGVRFVLLDNVSDPEAIVGDAQVAWLKAGLARLPKDHPIVVLTHRPLFDLAPDWDWATRDGQKVIDVLMPYSNVTVFYGHIHQEHHFATAQIQHHAGKGLMFALPAPMSVPKKAPIPWDPSAPYKGLGFRDVEANAAKRELEINELPVVRA